MNMTNAMRPAFWARFNFRNMMKANKIQNIHRK